MFHLITGLIIYFYFLILMTGSASNLTLNLVLHHDKLKNLNRVVLRGALVEVSGIQMLFHWIGLKSWSRNMYNTTLYVHYLLRYQGGGAESTPAPPTYIRQQKANQDRVKWHGDHKSPDEVTCLFLNQVFTLYII